MSSLNLPPRLVSALAIVGVLLAPVGGAAAGIAAARAASAPSQREVVIVDPATATGGIEGLRSTAGFTGFDGPAALGGRVVRTGTMSETRDGRFEVTADGATLAARTTSTARLFRIERASTPLSPGEAVQLRLDASGALLGVLRVPADLHEGQNRPTPTATATPTPAPTP